MASRDPPGLGLVNIARSEYGVGDTPVSASLRGNTSCMTVGSLQLPIQANEDRVGAPHRAVGVRQFFYDRLPLSRPGERVLNLYASKHLTPSRLAKQSVCVYGRGGNFNSLAPARPVGSIRFRLACDRRCFRFRVRHASLPIEHAPVSVTAASNPDELHGQMRDSAEIEAQHFRRSPTRW